MRWLLRAACAVLLAVLPLLGQQFSPFFYAGMQWRLVGPFRGGRVTAVAGVPGEPGVYYFGTPDGGLWKTTDAGNTWDPIFERTLAVSIGAVAVAPSNPRVIYVGTGDVTAGTTAFGAINLGDGVWRSDDAGRDWRQVGLSRTGHIGAIWVDPRDANVLLVAALGRTYNAGSHRGVYRSTNGGRSWVKTLFVGNTAGAVDLAADPAAPGVIYASVWRHHLLPPPAPLTGGGEGGGGIYKSDDGGRTWRVITGHGLPAWPMGRIGLAAENGRVFAIVCRASQHQPGGLFRSDDGGASWRQITRDPRIAHGDRDGYFGKVWMDPRNWNVVFVVKTSLYRSLDGGRTFSALKGAPGGDDYHDLWIDPEGPCVALPSRAGCLSSEMVLGSDQGAAVSLNAGQTWSTWYNQPTAQVYHIATDLRFPFRIYGPQQDSGSFEIRSRGEFGAIGVRDGRPSVGAYEYGYVEPDPGHPQWIFASGSDGQIQRMTRGTWQLLNVAPPAPKGTTYRYAFGPYRGSAAPPFVFSREHPGVLYEGTQFVLSTSDGGRHWSRISPDLTLRSGLPVRRGPAGKASTDWAAISALAPSPVSAQVIWAGTDDGLVQVTRDGGADWRSANLQALGPLDTISMIEASPFRPAEAYAVVDRHAWGDFRPYIYRTKDFGRTWQLITSGVPDGSFVRVVRADPKRSGLLYAGTETGVYVSFDDGGEWQSLQLNLPPVSVRDLALRGGDLVAGTFGRAVWILDDLSPLRQMNAQIAAAPAYLFRPAPAIRLRRDANYETPSPPEVPAGTNPPAGAVLDYLLRQKPAGPVTLSIFDAQGHLVRGFSTGSRPQPPPKWPTIAAYWMAGPNALPAQAGMNRFVWDLRYSSPPALSHSYPISALVHDTPVNPRGPLVAPGRYTVRLTVSGKTYAQPLIVRRDPRETTTPMAFAAQEALEMKIMAATRISYSAFQAARQRGDGASAERFAAINVGLNGLMQDVDSADVAPTPRMYSMARRLMNELARPRVRSKRH